MKSLFSPRWTALGLAASLSVPFLAHAVAQQKPAKPAAKKPATTKKATPAKKTGPAKAAVAKPKTGTKPATGVKPATAAKPAATPAPQLPKPSPALVKSVQSLNAILAKNTVINLSSPLPDGGKDVLKSGWRAAAGNGNRLLLTNYDIHETLERTGATPLRRESWKIVEIPLKDFRPESVTIKKKETKKRVRQKITIAAAKSTVPIKMTMSTKTLPVDEARPDYSTATNFMSYSFTFPDQPWAAEFASKLKEVIAVGAA